MASSAQQVAGLRCPSFSSSFLSKRFTTIQTQKFRVLSAVAISNAETRERLKLKQIFQEARERCEDAPTNGISFTVEDFEAALNKFDLDIEIGNVVRGTVVMTDEEGAVVDIRAKSLAYLPPEEACIYEIEHVQDAGVVPGLTGEFLVIDQNDNDDSFVLSLKSIQYDIAWERCRQLQAEDAVVKGKVVDANSGGLVVLVESLTGFVPFSQISMYLDPFESNPKNLNCVYFYMFDLTVRLLKQYFKITELVEKSDAEELIEREIPLKFVDVDEEQSRIVLSNRRAIADRQSELGVGSVVTGTVQSIKPYGAFVDIGGINGLLHVSQISHDRVTDIATVLQPGDTLKVMILSRDRERGRLSLSTKKLEPTPGDMIHNPQLVFEKAEEMGRTFSQRIAKAEAMARADMLRFQPESGVTLGRDGILGVLGLGSESSDSNGEGLDFRNVAQAAE